MSNTTTIIIETVAKAVFIIVLAVAYMSVDRMRAKAIVKKWASSQGFQIVSLTKEFFIGPFSFWKTSRSQVIFAVTILDQQQQHRSGWVKCGSFWGGVLFGDEIEVNGNGNDEKRAEPRDAPNFRPSGTRG